MAPSFMSLPTEIRLKVYRYLLVDGDISGNFEIVIRYEKPKSLSDAKIRAVPSGWRIDKLIQCAILRTCSQIYSEAVIVLYGENVFWYLNWNKRYSPCRYGKHEADLPMKHVKLIRYLRMEVNETSGYAKIQCFVDFVSILSKEVQFLIALNLVFSFEDISGFKDEEKGPKQLPGEVASSAEILEFIANMDIRQEIQINVFDKDWKTTAEAFQGFAQRLAVAKSWCCTDEVGVKVQIPTWWDSYECTWKLRPNVNTLVGARTRHIND